MTKLSTTINSVKPTAGHVLIRPEEQTKQTSSGIYLPDSAAGDKPQQGQVLAVGDSEISEKGQKRPAPAKQGDIVIYKKWGGNDVKIDGKEYLFVKFEDILAVIS